MLNLSWFFSPTSN